MQVRVSTWTDSYKRHLYGVKYTESDAIGIRYQKKLSCAACIWALHFCWFICALSLMNSNSIQGTGICMENKCSDSESFITQDDINNYESRCNEWISRMGRVALTVSTIDNVCTRNTRFLRSITTLNFTTGSCLSSLENESFCQTYYTAFDHSCFL